MAKRRIRDSDCVIAKALEDIGEGWTLLILRNAFHGMRRFEHFEQNLGIATNILSDRLKRLTEAGIMARRRSQDDGRVYEYRLTAKGLDLYPVIVSLLHFGERWYGREDGPHLRLVERATGKPVSPMSVRSHDGRPLAPTEVTPVLGPTADKETKALVAHHNQRRGK